MLASTRRVKQNTILWANHFKSLGLKKMLFQRSLWNDFSLQELREKLKENIIETSGVSIDSEATPNFKEIENNKKLLSKKFDNTSKKLEESPQNVDDKVGEQTAFPEAEISDKQKCSVGEKSSSEKPSKAKVKPKKAARSKKKSLTNAISKNKAARDIKSKDQVLSKCNDSRYLRTKNSAESEQTLTSKDSLKKKNIIRGNELRKQRYQKTGFQITKSRFTIINTISGDGTETPHISTTYTNRRKSDTLAPKNSGPGLFQENTKRFFQRIKTFPTGASLTEEKEYSATRGSHKNITWDARFETFPLEQTPKLYFVDKNFQESKYNSLVVPDRKDLRSQVSQILGQLHDPMFHDHEGVVKNARLKEMKKYLENLDKTRASHPILSHDLPFNYLQDVMKIVNSSTHTLISIDCEFQGRKKLPSEIGISIFNPKRQDLSIMPNLSTHHIIVSDHYDFETTTNATDTFLSGRSMLIPEVEVLKFIQLIIDSIFNQEDKAAFVGHSVNADLKSLCALGIKLPETFTSIDTFYLYACSHGFRRNTTSLGGVLNRFNIPHGFLHNAGNDAYYSLLVLLKLTDPMFRKSNKLDDYIEDMKYEHDWRVQTHLMKENGKVPVVFDERDVTQWNSFEFSLIKKFDDSENALKHAFGSRYKK